MVAVTTGLGVWPCCWPCWPNGLPNGSYWLLLLGALGLPVG